MTASQNIPTKPLSRLRDQIAERFSLEELRRLIFDLGLDYDEMRGEEKSAKIQALLMLLQGQDRIPDLITLLKRYRPNKEWDDFFPAQPDAQSPYKGLQFFTEEDADLFFGRKQLTAELIDHLRQHRFLAVVGASGSGKSSVVRAGIIPLVKSGEIEEDGLRSDTWKVHVITPTEHPLQNLATSLTHDSESVTAAITLADDLRQDSRSLDIYVSRILEGQPNGRILLVVDQFEELFTQCDDLEDRRLFVENLVTAVSSGKQGRLLLILTLRADFYAFAVQYESLRPLLETRQKIVGAMNQEELRQAIEGPAQETEWQLQPGLVDTMLQAIGREPGALPLLSHALQETWERREGRVMTLAGYHAAGGVRRAIAQTADTVYARLTPEEQAIARNIFLRLTELGEGTEDTRRRASLAELLPQGEMETAVQDVLDLLTRKRLVTLNEERSGGDASQNYAEVAHEALIREWPALREWLDEDREGLRIHRQLTAVAKEWQAAGEEPGYLYRGARLAQALEWASQHETQLNELEQRFLVVSETAVVEEEAEREAQRQRELEQAQQLAEAQTQHAAEQARRVTIIRQALGLILFLLIIAIGAAIFGFAQSGIASDNLATAVAAKQTTEAERDARATQEALAFQNANLAGTRAIEASNAQATAEYNAQLATTRETEAVVQARIAQSQSLAAASLSVQPSEPMRSLLLAIAAGQIADTPQAFDALFSTMSLLAYPRQTLQHENLINGAAWNGDESRVLTWSSGGTVWVWDAVTGMEKLKLISENIVYGAEWSGDENQVLTWGSDGMVSVWDITTGTKRLQFVHKKNVLGAAWSGNDNQVLTWGCDEGDEYGNTCIKGAARIWDSVTGKELLRFTHEDRVLGATWNGDESRVLTWSADGTARVWDIDMGAEQLRFDHEGRVNGAAWNGVESQVLTWSADGTARVWDIATGVEKFRLTDNRIDEGPGASIIGAVWNRDESLVLAWIASGRILVWDATNGTKKLQNTDLYWVDGGASWNGDGDLILIWGGQTVSVLDADTGEEWLRLPHESRVNGAAWNVDGRRVLTWMDDGTTSVWDLAREDVQLRLPQESRVLGASWNEEGNQVLTWSDDGAVRIWDTRAVEQHWLWDSINGAMWNRDENQVLTWGGDARVWDTTTGEELLQFNHDELERDPVNGAMWNKDENRILTWSDDGTTRMWDMITGEELMRFAQEGPSAYITGAMWNNDESEVLTWGCDEGDEIIYSCTKGTARVWNTVTGEEMLQLPYMSSILGATWNGDESQVLTWGCDEGDEDGYICTKGAAWIWDGVTGKELLRFTFEDWVLGATWNGDESRILTWGTDGTTRVWNAITGGEQLQLVTDDSVWGAAWNGDGSRLMTWGGFDSLARIWDGMTGKELLRLTHEDSVLGAAWSADESQVLTWSDDGTARVWDGETGKLLFSLKGDETSATMAQWSLDGRRILFVTEGGLLRVIYSWMADLLPAACDYTTRNLTWQEWQLYFPGQQYQVICDQWPVHPSVPQEQQ